MSNTKKRDLIDSFPSNSHSRGNFNGLTKLEYLSSLAMQGLLSNPNGAMMQNGNTTYSPFEVSKIAIEHAESLINRLNENANKQ